MLPRIAMVSTYPPTRCGIATFARSLGNAMVTAGADIDVVALGSDDRSGVRHIHDGPHHLPQTAQVLSEYQVVILQHEFGIYAGEDGADAVSLLGEIETPVITVLHTVPPDPTPGQRRNLQALLDGSDAIVVMSYSADRILRTAYSVRPHSVRVIPHGASDMGLWRSPAITDGRPRLLTWGLLSESKGIEWGIHAMAQLRDLDPSPEYVVLGATHPKVKAREGERYREQLVDLAQRLGVSHQVTFMDTYLTTVLLTDVISTATAYLLPYESRVQICSGVLVEAVVAGGPVIATRFPHAEELLAHGTGFLVDHEDADGIARAFRSIVERPREAARRREMCRALSQSFLWESVAEDYLDLAAELWRGRARTHALVDLVLPEPSGLVRAIS